MGYIICGDPKHKKNLLQKIPDQLDTIREGGRAYKRCLEDHDSD